MNAELELRHLRYFLAVAEELHFGRAALRLHIAQPPLSQQIRRLEEILGYPLFVRSSRSVSLTAAGEVLYARVQRSMANLREDLRVVRGVARGEEGSITVGFVGSAMLTRLPGLLGRYRVRYPRVELRLQEFHTAQLLEEMVSGAIDVGFLRDPGPVDGLQAEAFWSEPFCAFVPATHALGRRKKIRVEQLREEPFVFFPRAAGEHAWENTMELCRTAGYLPRVVQEAPQWLTVIRLVGAGLGVTIAPGSVRSVIGQDVVCLKLSGAARSTGIFMVRRREEASPLVAALSELVYSAGESARAR